MALALHSLKRRILLSAAALSLAACATTPQGAPQGPAPHDGLNAAFWMQQSVEYKATAKEIYALATLRLDKLLADKTMTAAPAEQRDGYETLPPAIILDADETVLDNAPYQAWMVKSGNTYSRDSWNAWASAGEAQAIPGAAAFTQAAASNGVTVFYVTNRLAETEEGTVRNLAALGFPIDVTEDGKSDQALLRNEQPDWTSAKGTRRAKIAENYRILMLLGDNFGDFTDAYKGAPAERQAVYEQNSARWGREWIMLPNPSYGSWESAAFGNDYALTPEQQRQRKIDALQSWSPEGE